VTAHDLGPASVSATKSGARKSDQLASEITSENTKSANAVKFHPLADMLPLTEGEEFDVLVDDIKANGLHEQIILYDGMILDGRNRYRACVALGWTQGAIRDMALSLDSLIDEDYGGPAAYVISANIHRRHLNLTAEQRRELIAKLIKAQPEKSDRQIAATAKASPTTVGTVRAKLGSTVQPGQLAKRVGKDGKARKLPAKRPTDDDMRATKPERDAKKKKEAADAEATWRHVHEETCAKMERLASRLLELDRDGAQALQEAIVYDDRVALRSLERALARGLGLDDDDGSAAP
jgi:hypothetical protein